MGHEARALLIAGPTASGKSALAMAIAEEFGGVVINADSMQVYRELRILTARPTPEDEARVPHRLYGFRPAAEPYSVALWLEDVEREIESAEAQGLLPVIAGGTGLYFAALTEGLSDIPEIPPEIRDHWRNMAERHSGPELHAMLAERDPETAGRLRPSDRQRLVRALEVVEATGRGLSRWQEARRPPLLPESKAARIVLTVDRPELYRRCDERFDAMMEAGALKEAARIRALNLPPHLPAMRAVGLPPLITHLEGKVSLAEAVRQAKTDTRRYAKRQLTWIRRKMITWKAIHVNEIERTKAEVRMLLKRCLTSHGRRG